MTKPNTKSAAIVTIFRGYELTPKGRRDLAAWLRKEAAFLLKEYKSYASKYTARYLYD